MNSVETAPPTFWVGESGVRRSGTSLLERLEPPHLLVEVGVVEGRVVEHVVAPARVLDLLGEHAVLLAQVGLRVGLGGGVAGLRARDACLGLRLAHGSILPCRTDSRARVTSGAPPIRSLTRSETLGDHTIGVTHALSRTRPQGARRAPARRSC